MNLTSLMRARCGPTGLLTLAVGLALVLGLLCAVPRSASAGTDGVLFGGRVQAQAGEDNQKAVQRLETLSGRKLDVVREFLSWDSAFPQTFHTWLRDTDHTMILSVKSKRENGQVVAWRDLAASTPGDPLYDTATSWADRLRDYGKPVYFAFNHEPESSASSTMGTPADFIAAWRTMHDIFLARGATNVKFVWIMTDYAFFVGSQAPNDASKWFPGDDYLDAMGIDAYNWYTCRPGINNPWKSLEQIIKPFRDFGAKHPDEELWLTEWASAEDNALPGRKAAWINEARALFKRPDYAQFRGISTFNYMGTTTCFWKADSSTTTTTAFRAMAQDRFYGGPSADPAPTPTPPVAVAAASANGDRTQQSVKVPTSVEPGDTLLMFFTANQYPVRPTTPTGWTTVRTVATSNVSSRLWSRVADRSDPGSTLTITTSVRTKSDLKVVALRGASTPTVDVLSSMVDSATRPTYWARSVTPRHNGELLLVYWADKSSTNAAHSIAGSLKKLQPTTTGTTGGHITATVAAARAGSAGTPTGGFGCTGSTPASRAVAYTLALRS